MSEDTPTKSPPKIDYRSLPARRLRDIRHDILAELEGEVGFSRTGLVETAVSLRFQLMAIIDRQALGEEVPDDRVVKIGGALSRAMRALGLEKLQPKKTDHSDGELGEEFD